MIKIAHRGNITGPNPKRENHPDYIDTALKKYDVEIDLRRISSKLYLGHDGPDYEISINYLRERNQRLWIHAKNTAALELCLQKGFHCFSHEKDDVVLTSLNYLWTYPGKELGERSIAVMPDMLEEAKAHEWLKNKKIQGICTDNISKWVLE